MKVSSEASILNQQADDYYDAEKKWDVKAAQYNASQKRQGLDDSNKMAEMLHQKQRLMKGAVLDVGGGTGLYAIPFASYAKSVTVTDLSTNMLSYAKENAIDAGLNNLEYVKLDWNKANLEEMGWKNHFDLVYSAMCPAIRSGESVDKMIAASKNWCCVNRFVRMKDSATDSIEKISHYSKPYDPHNNRQRIQEIFNYLWEKGYEPEIDYYEETVEKLYTVDEAAAYYGKRFNDIAQSANKDLREIISDLSENNHLTVNRYKKLAFVSWQV